MPSALVNEVELYFERAGTGTPLLFLNGSGSTLASVTPLLEVFSGRFDLLAHDQRGLGRSAIPPGPYTMAQYAADALGLLDFVGWPTCRVVGISFGGMVAQELAVTAPQRVDRLALLCTSPGGEGGSSFPLHELAGLSPRQRAAASVRLLDTRFSDEWLAAHPGDGALVDTMAQRASGPRSQEARRGEAEQLDARHHHDVWGRLERIACPTFVGSGRYDGIAPLANSEAIVTKVAGATLHVYEGGHAFFVQDRRALPDVMDFLAS